MFTGFVILFILTRAFSQNPPPSVYYKNFVHHQDGSFCTHLVPEASFTVYLNNDPSRILIENAPRWETNADPNIPGSGVFGIELGNFGNPGLTVGDSVFIRFTCSATQQQGLLTGQVAGIPWGYFPQNLYLQGTPLPETPQNLSLSSDSTTFYRTLSWDAQPGVIFAVYRRSFSDTLWNGQPRMQYYRIAEGVTGNQFVDSTALPGERYGYILYARSAAGIYSTHSPEVNEAPRVRPGMDLTIGYIARLPRMEYVWGSPQPEVDGWPLPGQVVTWEAMVKNWADSNLYQIPYRWVMDGTVVDSGTVDIPASTEVGVDYPWMWTFERHELRFDIDTRNLIAEEEEGNNSLTIYTDAISVGFYVEQSVYDYFHQYQKELEVGSNCWEDWAQRQVRIWNQMFANAIYPDSPQGVLDRIRIDAITVVPDGALPLAGGLPTNNPNLNDRTVDLQWGFPASLLNSGFYSNHTSISMDNPFYYEGSLLHELGHARYLIDIYGFNVHDDGTGNTVAIEENGQLIVGTPLMPMVSGDAVYYSPIQGLMNGQYTFIDDYSTVALNRIAGHRATYGNYNAPGNIGVFLQDLPDQNALQLLDMNGNPLPFAGVQIYRAGPQPGVWYGKFYDSTPDLQFNADSNGVVLLGRCPFSEDGIIKHTYGFANGVLIVRVAYQGLIGYAFLEVTQFNMEYWRGNNQLGNYQLNVPLLPPLAVGKKQRTLPSGISLRVNPNPFNQRVSVNYILPEDGQVTLQVFDILGRKVRQLLNEKQTPGEYQLFWKGDDDTGQALSSGLYIISLRTGSGQSRVQKVMLVK